MKTRILLLILAAVTACTPKNTPRYTHEQEKTWTPASAPNDDSVEVKSLTAFEMKPVYAAIKNPQGDLKVSVLNKLAPFVLNAKFVETPSNRTTKLGEMIAAFNGAFVRQLTSGDRSPEFAKIKQDYINTALSGCSRDLRRDCQNLEWFSMFPNHARIFTLLAKELDAPIETALKKAASDQACMAIGGACHDLVERRYYYLSVSAWNKRAHYDETEFKIAFLKHARLFAMFVQADLTCGKDEKEEACRERQKKGESRNPDTSSMSYSYLAQMHAQIFQTIIGKYQPSDYNDPEFKTFVEAFNPWAYSIRAGDVFQGSASRMFEFGTQCCLYTNKERTKLNDAVTVAIQDSQMAKDHFIATAGISFRALIPEIKKEHLLPDAKNPNHRYDTHEYDLFKNLGILDVAKRVENDPSFFNEYFFVVDRLFRGHIGSGEVEKLLRNTDSKRTRELLPRMIADYVKIHLAYMVVETNRFMADIYKENLASTLLFQEAISRSRSLTNRWQEIQQQTNLLRQVMVSYTNSLNLPADQLKTYMQTDATLKAVTRNIHYLTVFPNMMVMTYHLTKDNASVAFTTWWGADFKKEGSQILKQLLNGEEKQTWFQYGVNTEVADRLTLLYSLEYLLSTEALNSFVAQETKGAGKDRSSFFDLIFGKYLDDGVTDLRSKLTVFERATIANPSLSWMNDVCNYETGKGGIPPKISINFMDLTNYTYTGVGNTGLNAALTSYLTSSVDSLQALRRSIESRRTYMEAMVHVIASELLRTGKIKALTDEHPDLTRARSILKDLSELRSRLAEVFISSHKRYYECYSKLQEVERRRMNRLYDEEREYLSQVFDLMKPLFSVADGAALDAKADEINKLLPGLFPRHGADVNRARFSRVSGRNFLMANYDLLMRMKTRIEADIFRTPSRKESALVLSTDYYRPRSVEVIYPITGVEDNTIYTQAVVYPISMRGTSEADRTEFIRQGMMLLGGSEGILGWHKARAEEKTLDWSSDRSDKNSYLQALMEFYLMGPVTVKDGSTVSVTMADLVGAYIDSIASQTMDDIDLQNASDFSRVGRRPKDYFLDGIFQKDGETPEALFYSLMREINKMAAMDMNSAGPLKDALDLAKTANSLQAFNPPSDTVRAFVFQPSNAVKEAVLGIYGQQVNGRLQRVADLFSYLNQIEQDKDPLQLDTRLAQPFYSERGVQYRWYDKSRRNLVDKTKYNDLRYLIDLFAQKSGDIYGTRKNVKY